MRLLRHTSIKRFVYKEFLEIQILKLSAHLFFINVLWIILTMGQSLQDCPNWTYDHKFWQCLTVLSNSSVYKWYKQIPRITSIGLLHCLQIACQKNPIFLVQLHFNPPSETPSEQPIPSFVIKVEKKVLSPTKATVREYRRLFFLPFLEQELRGWICVN